VQQRTEAHHEVGGVEHAARRLVVDRLLEHGQAVLVHILVPVMFVALEPQGGHLREHAVRESGVDEQADATHGGVCQQQLRQFVADAFGRDPVDLARQRRHCRVRAVFYLEAELRREPRGPEHPQRVVAE
jgi:hypothetical protein